SPFLHLPCRGGVAFSFSSPPDRLFPAFPLHSLQSDPTPRFFRGRRGNSMGIERPSLFIMPGGVKTPESSRTEPPSHFREGYTKGPPPPPPNPRPPAPLPKLPSTRTPRKKRNAGKCRRKRWSSPTAPSSPSFSSFGRSWSKPASAGRRRRTRCG